MSDQNHYLKLGVDENASFEEIQDARNRLVQEHSGDRKLVESIEAAYDAILMDRLRLRQEGKIKVPDRIRFPERLVEAPPEFTPIPTKQTPDWLQRFIDTPSRADILWPAALFLGTALLSLTSASVGLALGVGFSLYFLNRKEHKFGRAFLITLVSLILGVILGLQAASLLQPQLTELQIESDTFAAWITFFILWLTDSFLR
ncbi:MAG: molecular chaperone DnaJ [Leptolyngbyaceae cyanobacterium RM2_2_4]|nr:molecular chaperone DnaJ [Leptolyngbyaceae cyanobacterium SM1_4_3]NJN91515.1 molecular chaperone DnaJ [Leptolyngbyaceae cyanobacterium SL_5_14]NJO52056.1 molecular chaperone DnaJ [Leptolyngbyaceae cyanobacterium RM2_2_4]